ncbi:MAG: type II secretion system F family protein [Patescibacteria group bacterium]
MLYNYRVTTKEGQEQEGSIDAPSSDIAISSLQRRGLIVIKLAPVGEKKSLFNIRLFDRVKTSDIVILSRQIATLFEAKVSALETFRLLASESENPILRQGLTDVTDDIKGGITISDAMAKHPDIFSEFYVSMIRSGEEAGKLSETFNYLADYLDRSYALISKAKNALVYPIFVICSFAVVMMIMAIFVIPRLGEILADSGQQLPIYTRAILGISNFLSQYWILLLALAAALAIFLVRYLNTPAGHKSLSAFKLSIPYVSNLYKKLYLSRIADNLNTMITSGVSMVRALEITAAVVDNDIYEDILIKASVAIKAGGSVSDVFSAYSEIPRIMVQMMKVGEETGRLGFVLETLAKFYEREVENAVETLVGLIEPIMIVALGLAVGVLLAAVLVPIYNAASAI